MATTYHPVRVRAAVNAIAQADERMPAKEIHRRLEAGSLQGLDGPYERAKERTVQGWVQRARQDLDAIHPDEQKAINSLERRMLRLVNRDVARLERVAAEKGLGSNDSAALRSHHLTISQIRNERKKNAVPKPDPERSAAGRNGGRAAQTTDDSLLDRIAADMERRAEG